MRPSEPGGAPAAGAAVPKGLAVEGPLRVTVTRAPHPCQAAPLENKKKPNAKLIKQLSDLPDDVWVDAAHDDSGFQFYTKIRIGLSNHHVMLDGGSAVNSVAEEILVGVLNENKAAGISLNDERHSIRQMENGTMSKG